MHGRCVFCQPLTLPVLVTSAIEGQDSHMQHQQHECAAAGFVGLPSVCWASEFVGSSHACTIVWPSDGEWSLRRTWLGLKLPVFAAPLPHSQRSIEIDVLVHCLAHPCLPTCCNHLLAQALSTFPDKVTADNLGSVAVLPGIDQDVLCRVSGSCGVVKGEEVWNNTSSGPTHTPWQRHSAISRCSSRL